MVSNYVINNNYIVRESLEVWSWNKTDGNFVWEYFTNEYFIQVRRHFLDSQTFLFYYCRRVGLYLQTQPIVLGILILCENLCSLDTINIVGIYHKWMSLWMSRIDEGKIKILPIEVIS